MKKALILFLLAIAADGYSQVPYTLLKDAVPNVALANQYQGINAGSGDGVIFFSAETPLYGHEFYKTDGTEAGTVFIKDLLPGPESSYPQEFRMINGRVYFTTIISHDLWVSDGTSHGTFRLSEWGSIIGSTDDVVFFSNGDNVWRTDGTQEGTYQLLDSNFSFLGAAGSKAFLYRVANSAYEIWSSDGTEDGTTLVTSFNQPWVTGMGLGIGNRVYFVGQSFDTGSELWYLDANGTTPVLVKDIVPGTAGSVSQLIGAFDNKLLFIASGQNGPRLHITDGTANGTVQLGEAVIWESLFHPMTILNNEYYFIGTTDGAGAEVWKTDGTPNGTKLLKDIVSGPDSADPLSLTAHKGKVYFSVTSSPDKRKMWATDGTTAGTILLDVNNYPSVDAGPFVSTGGKLFFTRGSRLWATNGSVNGSIDIGTDNYPYNILPLNDGAFFALLGNGYFANGNLSGNTKIYALRQDVSAGGINGNPWDQGMQYATLNDKLYLTEGMGITSLLLKTDGTPEGTSVQGQMDIRIRNQMVELNGKLIFQTDLGELWSGDGTVAGMTLIKDLQVNGNADLTFIKKFNGRAYYIARNTSTAPYDSKLWSTDGTEAGTIRLDLPATAELRPANYFIIGEAGTDLLLAVYDQTLGMQIWKTSGAAAGTSLVKTLNTSITDPIYVYATDGTITYFAVTNNYAFELWRSNGTDAGTYKVKDMRTGTASISTQLITMQLVNGVLYFSANDGTNGSELWRSDGTEGGTTMVKDFLPGTPDSYPVPLMAPVVNDYFLVKARAANDDQILYKTDGTLANTILLKNFGKAPQLGWPMLELNGNIYFVGWDADHGSELWKTDGTPQGTVMVKDIFPGKTSSFIKSIKKAGSAIYFVANDDEHGYEIWRTDGTTCGTAMLTDDATTGVFDSFIVFGQKLVFPGYDRKIGSEYFSYDLTLTPPSGCKTTQTITFPSITGKRYGDVPFAPGASSSSGLAITYSSSNNNKLAIVSGNAVINGTGTFILTAMQKGNTNVAQATPVSIAIKIEKAVLTTTASERTKSYGDVNPELTLDYTGFVGGDNKNSIDEQPKAATTATMTSDVGDYSISVSGGSDDHYEFEFVAGTLHIQKADLQINASDKTVPYNEDIPELTFTTVGLKDSDDLGDLDSPVAISTTATKGSNAGEYPITFETISDNNYDISFGNGTLEIEKADQTIDFPAPDAIIAGGTTTLTGSASSGLMVVFIPVAGDIVITGENEVVSSSAGLATVVAKQNGNENYNPAPDVTRDFCVNPLKPILSSDDTEHVITSSESGDHEWYQDDVEVENETSSTFEVTTNGTFKAVAVAGECVSDPSEELAIVILGLENDEPEVIYPSPAKDFVYVKLHATTTTPSFTWMNSSGENMSIKNKIESDNGDNVIKFDITDIPAGMYILKMNSSVKKIIKIN